MDYDDDSQGYIYSWLPDCECEDAVMNLKTQACKHCNKVYKQITKKPEEDCDEGKKCKGKAEEEDEDMKELDNRVPMLPKKPTWKEFFNMLDGDNENEVRSYTKDLDTELNLTRANRSDELKVQKFLRDN